MPLIHHYKLDETTSTTVAADSVGSANGTYTVVDPSTDSIAGAANNTGSAIQFNGVDTYVDVTTGTLTFPMTITGWINPTNLDSKVIVGLTNAPASFVGVSILNSRLIAYLGADNWQYANSGTLTAGQWQHFAVVFSTKDAEDATLYINGIDVSSGSNKVGPAFSPDGIKIGTRYNAGGNFFSGGIDDVRLYDHSFTASEVLDLYLESLGPATLLAHYKLDENGSTKGVSLSEAANPSTNTSYEGDGFWRINTPGTFAGLTLAVGQDISHTYDITIEVTEITGDIRFGNVGTTISTVGTHVLTDQPINDSDVVIKRNIGAANAKFKVLYFRNITTGDILSDQIYTQRVDSTVYLAKDSVEDSIGDFVNLDPTTNSTTGATPNTGTSKLFEGTEYVEAVASISAPFTVAAWVKNTSLASSTVVLGLNGLSGEFAGLSFLTSRPIIYLSSTNFMYGDIGSVIQDEWAFLTATCPDGNASNAKMYVNGIDVSSGSSHTGSISDTTLIRIGRSMTGNREFNGAIDDVRLYDRVLLESEILELYEDLKKSKKRRGLANRRIRLGI